MRQLRSDKGGPVDLECVVRMYGKAAGPMHCDFIQRRQVYERAQLPGRAVRQATLPSLAPGIALKIAANSVKGTGRSNVPR